MLYLASQSPRRRALLRRLRRPFRIVRSTYREAIRTREGPAANAMRNALGKARHARLPRHAHGLVIGSDTLLDVQGRVIGKPRTLRRAYRLLQALSGKPHWVYTGLCLLDARTGRWRVSYDRSKVVFKPLTREIITRLFARSSPLDKAGGYALQAEWPAPPRALLRRTKPQGRAGHNELIACIKGSRSTVIGLPLELLRRELRRMKGHAGDRP